MDDFTIRLVRNSKEYEDVLAVRDTVFVREQKVAVSQEYDEYDRTSKHVIVLYKSKAVGCARIRTEGAEREVLRLERIALLKRYRGRGFGKEIMNYLMKYASRRKPREIVMHAQYYLVGFYRQFGFVPRGRRFCEAGIEHVEMYARPSVKQRPA